MSNLLKLSLIPGIISFVLAFLATPVVIKIAYKIGIIDNPRGKTHPKVIHTYPTPRGGGLAVYFAVLVTSLMFIPIDKHLIGILIGATLIIIMGLLDDKYNLNPYLRLVIGFIAASAPIIAGIGISFLSNPTGGIIDVSHPQITFWLLGEKRSIWVLSDIFALFWIVFLMNMLNMSAKGVDGQLPGVAGIAAVIIALLSLKFSADITQWPVILLASITAGAFWGFTPWNFYPQKIMPSYGGATLAGYLLAILSILSTTKVGTLVVCLSVPFLDTGYSIVRRMLKGKSPVWGDREHLHHRLLDLGWSKKKVTLFYWFITAVLGILSLYLNTQSKLYTIIGMAVLIGGLILWLTYRPKSINSKRQ